MNANIRKGLAGLAAACLFLPLAAGAGNLSYTYVEGGYVNLSVDDPDTDGDGWGLGGSFAVNEMIHVYGQYSTVDLDDFDADFDTYEVGIGGSWGIAPNADFIGRVGYVSAELDTDFGNVDDDGYSLTAALRGRLAQAFELEGGINYADLDDAGDDTTVYVDGRYYFTPQWAVAGGYSMGDDIDAWTLGVRWEMPR